MSVDKKSIMVRYFFVMLVMALIGVAVVIKAALIMFKERDYWNAVAQRFVKENVSVKPARGNILSADGKLMAGSSPTSPSPTSTTTTAFWSPKWPRPSTRIC